MHSFAYRLSVDSSAKKKSKKLVEIAGLMGFNIKLSRAQEIVAMLMGYENWTELGRVTAASPEHGVPDQMLPDGVAEARQQRQVDVLVQEFGIDEGDARGLLEALAPTGEIRGRHWPTADRLGLRLDEEDEAWLLESMRLIRTFDAAVRPLYTLSPPPSVDHREARPITHISVHRHVRGRTERNRRDTTPADIVALVAGAFPADTPLAGDKIAEVTTRAEAACRAFAELDERIRRLGSAPMLAPVDWTFLMLHRSRVSGDNTHYTALSPEPCLHIGFDLPRFCFNPENEWNASRALSLQLALRREFLDAGWTGDGAEWRVQFRDRNSAKEEVAVRATSAGAAYAWAAAARAALRLAKHEEAGSISLLSVLGPEGAADPGEALAVARTEPIIARGKLLAAERLRVRGRRAVA